MTQQWKPVPAAFYDLIRTGDLEAHLWQLKGVRESEEVRMALYNARQAILAAEKCSDCTPPASAQDDAKEEDCDIPELRSQAEIGFEEWLIRQMPKGTVISNPAWWAPRILSAAMRSVRANGHQDAAPAAGDARDAARYRWLKERNGGPIGIVAWHRDEEQEMVLVDDHADAAIDAAIAASQRQEG